MIMIPATLFGISFGILAWVLSSALISGAQNYSGTYSVDTARQFEDIFLFIPPKKLKEIAWAGAATFFILLFLLTGGVLSQIRFLISIIISSGAAGVALQSPKIILTILKLKRKKRFEEQLVDALLNMSNALKAGFSITQSFESVVKTGSNPIAQEFNLCLQQTRLGVSFTDALHNLDERMQSEDLSLLVTSIETARKTGGNLTEIFDRIAATIRERSRIEGRIKTLTAQGRLQGIVVSALPVIIGTILLFLDPNMMIPFLKHPIGIGIIAVIITQITCGALIIRKIINIDI